MSKPIVVANSARWTVADPANGAGVRVTLSMPIDKVDSPVDLLVLLDGDTMFQTATEFSRTVRRVTMGNLPPLAVVGIMRDEPDQWRYTASRFRDFTPQAWELHGPFADDNAMVTMGAGQAAQFADLISGQVLPEVFRHLEDGGFNAGDVTIGGWSLSGLFACWAWLDRPDMFRHVVAISPSLWWDDASIMSRPMGDQSGRRAFICAGEHEEGDVELVWPRIFANGPQREMAAMVRNAERFARNAASAGADVRHVTYADEHHVTLQAAAVTAGLRHVLLGS